MLYCCTAVAVVTFSSSEGVWGFSYLVVEKVRSLFLLTLAISCKVEA